MKLKNILYLFLLLCSGCASFKKELVKIGGSNEAIQNAIVDFSNTSNLYKKDSVFIVAIYDSLYNMVLEETQDGNMKWVNGLQYQDVLAVSRASSKSRHPPVFSEGLLSH